jgi:hypothetical protein
MFKKCSKGELLSNSPFDFMGYVEQQTIFELRSLSEEKGSLRH